MEARKQFEYRDINKFSFYIKNETLYCKEKNSTKLISFALDSRKLDEIKKIPGLLRSVSNNSSSNLSNNINNDKSQPELINIKHLALDKLDLFFSCIFSSAESPAVLWMYKVVFLSRKIAEIRNQRWEMEDKIIAFEKSLLELGDYGKRMTAAELENIYPAHYKQTEGVRPTDYKIIKFEELRKRIDALDLSKDSSKVDSSKALSKKQLEENLKELKSRYFAIIEPLQELENQLSKYSKEKLTELGFRKNARAEINTLPLDVRVAAISMMPGETLMCNLIDIFEDLKKVYEQALRENYLAATKQELTFNTFEDLFQEITGKRAKDYYKEFAKRPTEEMANAGMEFNKIKQEFWKKKNCRVHDNNAEQVFNQYFLTMIYLSSTYQTFYFTDQVSRLEISAAVVFQAMGGFFGGNTDSPVNEFRELTAIQVRNSFAIMPFCSAIAEITGKAIPLFEEAIICLFGLYQRILNQVAPQLKENDRLGAAAFLHLGDEDDRKFFENKSPLVKSCLAVHHLPHAIHLLLRMPKVKSEALLGHFPIYFQEYYQAEYFKLWPQQPEQQVAQLVQTEKLAQVEKPSQVEKPAQAEKLAQDSLPENKRENLGCYHNKSTSVLFQLLQEKNGEKEDGKVEDKINENIKESIKENLDERIEEKEVIQSEFVKSEPVRRLISFEALNKVAGDGDAVKFAVLDSELQGCQLTEMQNIKIESLKPQFLNTFNSYINAPKGDYYRPAFLSRWLTVFQHTHHEIAVRAINVIKNSNSPREYILELYKSWADCDKTSTKLRPGLTEHLTNIFTILHAFSMPLEEVEKPTEKSFISNSK